MFSSLPLMFYFLHLFYTSFWKWFRSCSNICYWKLFPAEQPSRWISWMAKHSYPEMNSEWSINPHNKRGTRNTSENTRTEKLHTGIVFMICAYILNFWKSFYNPSFWLNNLMTHFIKLHFIVYADILKFKQAVCCCMIFFFVCVRIYYVYFQ